MRVLRSFLSRVRWSGLGSMLVLTTAAFACGKRDEVAHTKTPPAPAALPLVTAVEAPAPQRLVLTGMIAADQRSEVTADTQGKVINVMVERGQRVKFGAPVVQLDVRTAALSAREAQANLATARAQRQLAEEECKRTKELLDKGAITRSEYDRQITQCTSALQQVSAAEARAEMMSKSVADGIVRAPFDGMVAQRSVSPGEWVSPGRPLFTLVDDDPLKIEVSVPEAAVLKIKEGQEVEVVAVADPTTTYTATVTRIGAEIGRTRALIVEATIATPPRAGATPGSNLVPGMFAEARVTLTDKVMRPTIPREAVIGPCTQGTAKPAPAAPCRPGKAWHAFVVVKGEVHDRIVQLGPAPEPGKVSIIQGVATGDKVVAKVTDEVVDGLRVVE